MIHFSSLPKTDVVFTHIDSETRVETVFAVTCLLDWLAHAKPKRIPVMTPIVAEYARHFAQVRGLEAHRYAALTVERCKTPLLYCTMPDDTHLLVDGNHRYIWLAAHGFRHAPAYVLTEAEWRPFQVSGLPPIPTHLEKHWLESPSGIREEHLR